MTKTTPEHTPWEEKYQSEFAKIQIHDERGMEYDFGSCALSDDVQAFIDSLLTTQREELVRKVEGLKSKCAHGHRVCSTTVPCIAARTYNLALDDVIKVIKEV